MIVVGNDKVNVVGNGQLKHLCRRAVWRTKWLKMRLQDWVLIISNSKENLAKTADC